MPKLVLKKFNVKEMAIDSIVVMIGRRRTGKSQLITDILYNHRKFPVGIVISGTERANHYYENFVPKMFIYDEYDPAIIKRFLQRQEKITAQYKDEIKRYGKTDIDPRAFLILDDFLFDNSWVNDRSMRYIFMNGRHINIFCIVALQFSLGVTPNMRTNIDYVFILRENYLSNRKRLYEHFAGMFPSYEIFCQVMDQCTENYECLVIDNNRKSNKLEEQVYYYRADQHAPFKVCCADFWNMQSIEDERKRLTSNNREEEDIEEDFDVGMVNKKKRNNYVVNVRKR